jgi:hypothetical protein
LTTAIARQLLTQARVTVPLGDRELRDLAASVQLRIRHPIPLPPGIGAILYHGAFHPRLHITRDLYRAALVYATARHYLYGDSCLCYLRRQPGEDATGEAWQRIRRSALLAGALALGDDYEPARSLADLREVADLSGFPMGAISDYQTIREEAEAERDRWRFPDLVRRFRASLVLSPRGAG